MRFRRWVDAQKACRFANSQSIAPKPSRRPASSSRSSTIGMLPRPSFLTEPSGACTPPPDRTGPNSSHRGTTIRIDSESSKSIQAMATQRSIALGARSRSQKTALEAAPTPPMATPPRVGRPVKSSGSDVSPRISPHRTVTNAPRNLASTLWTLTEMQAPGQFLALGRTTWAKRVNVSTASNRHSTSAPSVARSTYSR